MRGLAFKIADVPSLRVLVGPCALLACTTQPAAILKCDKNTALVFDPYAHEVCLDACVDDLDCPRGTLCARTDETKTGTCKLGSDEVQTSRSVLLSGFDAPEMAGVLDTVDSHEFKWERPAGASVVQCALFSCAPAFRVPGDEGEWLSEADPERAEIANYDRCVLAEETSTQPDGAFNLRERDNVFRAPSELEEATKQKGPHCGATNKYGCAPIDALLVGCWAYDETRIVAATRLAPVDVNNGIFNFKNTFDDETGGCISGQHRVCRRSGAGPEKSTSIYGVCVEGECVAACTKPSDCTGQPDEGEDFIDLRIGYCVGATCASIQSGD